MKNDVLLQHDVVDMLAHEPDIDINCIGVEAHHGVVKLAGSVRDRFASVHAEQAARRVPGVQVVLLDLQLRRD